MAKGKYKRKRIRQQRRLCSIQDSGLSTRVIHILVDSGIVTLADLDARSKEELMLIPGIGEKAMAEIRERQHPASFPQSEHTS